MVRGNVQDLTVFSQLREQEKEVLVYNCISSADNPLTFGKSTITISSSYGLLNNPENCDISDERRLECAKVVEKHPLLTGLYTPLSIVTSSDTMFRIYSLFLHYLPAFVLDTAMRLRGEKPRLVSTYNKIDKVVETVRKFTNTTFFFDNQNMRDLYVQ